MLTQKKHLDLVALHHFIPFQLVLDLLIPGLALLLLRAHTATHLDLCVIFEKLGVRRGSFESISSWLTILEGSLKKTRSKSRVC